MFLEADGHFRIQFSFESRLHKDYFFCFARKMKRKVARTPWFRFCGCLTRLAVIRGNTVDSRMSGFQNILLIFRGGP